MLVIDKIRFVDARIGIGYLPEIPLPNFEISDIGKGEESNDKQTTRANYII